LKKVKTFNNATVFLLFSEPIFFPENFDDLPDQAVLEFSVVMSSEIKEEEKKLVEFSKRRLGEAR